MKNDAIIVRAEAMPLPSFSEPTRLDKARTLINQLGKNLHEHAYVIGKILIWVRQKIGTTKFKDEWIPSKIWFSQRTAYRFMAFAKVCDKKGKLVEYHPPKNVPSSVTVALPPGQYQTIIIDPPWPIQKIERYEAPLQGPNLDYKTMTVEAIGAIVLPTAPDCHLFLWTTQKFLPDSFQILEAWGFKYVLMMVWHKLCGFQPVGLPQYNCEFAVYARKGKPLFTDTKDFFCCFDGKRREHSRKPAEFYDIIRRVTPEPRINIFSREKIVGFECTGDEVDKF